MATVLTTLISNVLLGTYKTVVELPDQMQLNRGTTDPDYNKPLDFLATGKGYPFEHYIVETEDGYILEIHRIPHGRAPESGQDGKKGVILLMHGLFSSSAQWLLDFPKESPAFILADAGYDVWMGNARGTNFGRRHKTLNTKSKEFWSFSFHEIASYDMPAIIDFVLEKTGRKQLIYFGHSQGTTVMFVLLSTKPEYNKKIRLFVALAPVWTVGHITIPFRPAVPLVGVIKPMADTLHIYELLPKGTLALKGLTNSICNFATRTMCKVILHGLFSFGSRYFNATRLPVYVNHIPAGTSTQNLHHFAQLVLHKDARQYDHGFFRNLIVYGKRNPPKYNLDKFKCDVAIYRSNADQLADKEDSEMLIKLLGDNVIHDYVIDDEDFSHLDFAIGTEDYKLLYSDVLQLLDKYRANEKDHPSVRIEII